MATQPEALRLAIALSTPDLMWNEDERSFYSRTKNGGLDLEDATAELRRLHTETTNQQDWYVEWKKWEERATQLEALNTELLVALQNLVDEFGALPGLVHSERMKLHIARQAIAKATQL